ncbi:MAG: hypothetical protein HFH72_08320 [Lachnospiraceae bacterium]|nr:hypothetical protein [Lachnospiraceae bacterium]
MQGNKKKICFVVSGHDTWIVVQSMFEAAKEEQCFVVLLKYAYVDDSYYIHYMEKLKSQGVIVYYANEYRIEDDCPDVIVYCFDWHKYDGEEVSVAPENARKFVKKIVMVPLDMVVYEGYGSIADVSRRYLRQYADMCFVNPDYYQKFKLYQKNLILEGNPKFDYIYRKLVKKSFSIPDMWRKKIGNKKVVMWATTHGLDNRHVTPLYTFDIWAKDIIEYFIKHKEYVLLFRPTNRIFEDLILSGVCSYDECRNFEEMFKKEDNFILDNTPDYASAYKVSDMLLCPPNGMLLSYLPTKKPIVYTTTYRMNYTFNDENLIRNYYVVKDKIDLIKAIDDIFINGDPLYEKRMQTLKQYVPHFDGKIGERIVKRMLCEIDDCS